MRVLLGIVLVAAVTAAAPSSRAQYIETIEAQIEGVLHAQQYAWNGDNIDAFMDGYWRSDKTVFVSGDEVTRGWQKVLDRYKATYSDRAKMGALTFSDLEITPISNDSAVALGRWKLKRTNDPPSQNASPARTSGAASEPHGRFTLIFRKFPDGWKIIHDHTSAATPPGVVKQSKRQRGLRFMPQHLTASTPQLPQ